MPRSGAPRHVRTIATPVFLADDAVAALAVSLPAAEHSAHDADALAARTTGVVASLTAALSHR
jgi:DNA-binding IclR family transcriptional regulator